MYEFIIFFFYFNMYKMNSENVRFINTQYFNATGKYPNNKLINYFCNKLQNRQLTHISLQKLLLKLKHAININKKNHENIKNKSLNTNFIYPIAESTEESVIEPVKEVVAETVQEPVIEPVKEVVVEIVQEPVIEPVKEVVVETVQEPVIEPVKEVVVETVQEPVVETVVKPVNKVKKRRGRKKKAN